MSSAATYWTTLADYYVNHFTDETIKFYAAMLPFLQLNSAQRIAESGCGPGLNIKLLLEHLPPTANIQAWDITPKFVQITQDQAYPRTNVQVIDSQNLPFQDSSFDRYISNLCLNLVDDPQQMANEAFRVLQLGGIAGFSVWGKEDRCTLFSNLNAAKNSVIPPASDARSNFHLNSQERLEEIMRNAGFSRTLFFEEEFYFAKGLEDNVGLLANRPDMQSLLDNGQESEYQAIVSEFRSRLVDLMENKRRPLCFSAMIIIAYKD